MEQSFLYLLLIALLLAFVLILMIKKGSVFGSLKAKTSAKGRLDPDFVRSKWLEIETLIEQQKPSAYTTAIIEADKLVDYVLKAKVNSYGTMADRLKKGKGLFRNYSDYQNLWSAHKTRNMIVHDAAHELLYPEVKKTISSYEKALKALKSL